MSKSSPRVAVRSSLLEDVQLHIVHIIRVVANQTGKRELPDLRQLLQSERRRPAVVFEPKTKKLPL